MENDHVVLGTRNEWGQGKPVSLSCADRRHHLYVIGKSGTGKTTLLRNLILQDIAAGRGVGLIDPHGDLAVEILNAIPRNRIEVTTYFDAADSEFPVGINLLSSVPAPRRPLVVSGVVSVFKNAFSEFWGPRLEYILSAAVAALLDCENVSLLGIPRMLTDDRYRAWVVKQIKDPMVRSFWVNEFERYEKRFRSEVIAPIQNKVGQLLMSPFLRNVLGQVRNRIDARFMMDHSRIFIANLSKGRIGEDKANLLGALLVTQFQVAAMARADIPEPERRDFFLTVDEFQSVATDSFCGILSEARKYHLCLTLAHQYQSQLRPEVAKAVMGNVGSIAAFRVGHEDAESLERAFGNSYSAPAFTSLNNGEVYAKMLSRGRDLEPFHAKTHLSSGVRQPHAETIIKRSRLKYASPRNLVEKKIIQWIR